jgi:hypothetical protein
MNRETAAVIRSLDPDQARNVAALDPKDGELARLAEMNRAWFVLDEHGDLSVCRFTPDDVTGRERLDRYSFAAFRQKFGAEYLGAETIADAWLKWPGRRSFDRVTFAPQGEVPPDVLNLWRGWGVKPQRGDCERIVDHLHEVICDGDQALFAYVTGWMARMAQKPDQPGEVAIVLRGKEGTGKSVIGKLLRRIAGQHGIALSSPKHLVGEFNAMLEDAVFVEASEALFAGDRTVASRLKALVTDDTLTIERKGVDAREARNRVHLLMTSNEGWVVPAGPESRRWLVLDVSDKYRGDADYFDALWAQVNSDESVGAFLQELSEMDLSRFDVRKVPGTDALRDQRERSLTGVLAWGLDLASRGGVVQADRGAEPWRSFFGTRELYADYRTWVGDQRFERPLSAETFGREVRALLRLRWQRRAGAAHRVPEAVIGMPGYVMPETPLAFDRLVRARAGLLDEEEEQEGQPAATE